MKIALYIGNFGFPDCNAGGKRVYANGKILKELGYKVVFVGVNKSIESISSLKKTEKIYDDFVYYNFHYPTENREWLKYNSLFNNFLSFLNEENIIEDLELVIYYGSPRISLFISKLIRFCKHNQIKIIADNDDWLSPNSNSLLFNIFKSIDTNYQKAYLNKKANGLITVSKFLANYYKKAGCKTVIIPPLSPYELNTFNIDPSHSNKKIITYAGLPFRKNQKALDPNSFKDRIDKMVALLYEAKKAGCQFTFNIFGLTKKEYLYVLPSQNNIIVELGDSICFHGFTQNKEVVSNIIKSDFTFLIRDEKRDTLAGFPTKISESISCGTPVITTKTGDLADYIIEGENGFFIDTEDKKLDIEKFITILKLDAAKVKSMKEYCITNNPFYYKRFKDKMEDFLYRVLNED
jgi:glycosyltransferase involved in cell wall biosynthesis